MEVCIEDSAVLVPRMKIAYYNGVSARCLHNACVLYY